MSGPKEEKILYSCKKADTRMKDAYPENPLDEPCAKCIRKHYKLRERKNN